VQVGKQARIENARLAAALEMGHEKGLHEGLQQGLRQGLEQGALAGKRAVARTLLAREFDWKSIAELTGLSETEVAEIAKGDV
jgi:predicted transposase/invertase (TIGR01784 family)